MQLGYTSIYIAGLAQEYLVPDYDNNEREINGVQSKA